jgi:hypothetical protein
MPFLCLPFSHRDDYLGDGCKLRESERGTEKSSFLLPIFCGEGGWLPVGLVDSLTANEGLVRIQYKCLVPIHVFPEMKLLFPKQNYNVPTFSSYTHIFVRGDLYIFRIGLPIFL